MDVNDACIGHTYMLIGFGQLSQYYNDCCNYCNAWY